MKLFLILGCWGLTRNDFCLCGGVTNRILDLTVKSSKNARMLDYLDGNFFIFDKPIYNNIYNVLWNLQEKFSDKNYSVFNDFRIIEKFCISHKDCGLFLKLSMEEQLT